MCRRRGSRASIYRWEWSESTPRDSLIRNYLLASGAVSFIVAVWAVIYAGYSPITVAFLVIWLLIPFLLLYRFYDFKLGRRTSRGAFLVLILGAGILNLSSLIFAVYAGVNFPNCSGPPTESLTLILVPVKSRRPHADLWLTSNFIDFHNGLGYKLLVRLRNGTNYTDSVIFI